MNALYGVYGRAQAFVSGDVPTGGYFVAQSLGSTSTGLYASASGSSHKNWAGYFDDGDVYIKNKIGVGNNTPIAKIDINEEGTDNEVFGIRAVATHTLSDTEGRLTYGGYFKATKTADSQINYQYGVFGLAEADGYQNANYGGYFKASGAGVASFHNNTGVLATATGDGGTNYGIQASASGSSNKNWAGYFGAGDVYIQNNMGIGTTEPAAKLHVNGTIRGQYQSSDGTSGISGTRSWTIQINEKETETHTVVIKNGIIVSWDVLQLP
jgi:hypothetical protein